MTTATTGPQKVIGNTVLRSTCMLGLSVAKIVTTSRQQCETLFVFYSF